MIKNTEEARLRRIFDERKDIAKLIKKMNDLYYKGDFIKSLEIRKRIEEMWDKEKLVVLEVKRSVMDTVGDLPKEEQLEMLTMLHSIFFLSDIFVGILGDFKDAIKRVEPNSRMERFDGIEKLVKECEAEVSYLLKGCSLNYNIAFASNSDKLRDMVMDFTRNAIIEGTDMYEEEAKLSKE